MKKVLIFDNYDSFTYNLLHVVQKIGFNADVYRNDQISLERVADYDKIILSPGPGLPSESGLLLSLIKLYASTKGIFGVCLGHQAIAESFGGTLINLMEVYHGVNTPIQVIKSDYLFDGLPSSFNVGRYHSWVVENSTLPNEIEVTALSEEGHIMALKHKKYDVHGVQFHPESILTPCGETIIKNFLLN